MINPIIPLFAIIIAMNLAGCGIKTNPKPSNLKKISSIQFEGNYVSDGYEKKYEGYDWVAVTVRQTGNSTYHLRIRSRMDIKKPTCTFDAEATKLDSNKPTGGYRQISYKLREGEAGRKFVVDKITEYPASN